VLGPRLHNQTKRALPLSLSIAKPAGIAPGIDEVRTMNRWIIEGNVNPNARMRLFCMPYAGAGASIFHPWRRGTLSEAEICAIQLPGRESRILDKPFSSIVPLVKDLADAIETRLDKPFAFFGHSNGALICFELARLLRRRNLQLPFALIASGHNAPDLPLVKAPIAHLPEEEFLHSLKRLNGVPKEIETNREIMELLLPTLRADISVAETYQYFPEEPLDCPILAVYGMNDPETDYESILAWQRQTKRAFSAHMMPSDHFFLNSCRRELLGYISQYLSDLLNSYQYAECEPAAPVACAVSNAMLS
jgi:medium-chain acyl-[acyl-carrier-protein] hydrolase